MDLSLTESQQMLKDTIRRLMERECTATRLKEIEASDTGFPADIWESLAKIGLVGLSIPEEFGGGGGSYEDLGVLYYELGRACAPTPHFSSGVLCAQILVEAGSPAQKAELLPRIASGDLILALALTEQDFGWEADQVALTATKQGDSYVLQGTKVFVPDAQVAHKLIVAARTPGGVSLFLVDAGSPGLSVRNVTGFIGGRLNEITLDSVKVPASAVVGVVGGAAPVLDLVLARSAPVLAAYMVGGSEMAFEITRDYAGTRVAFGAPIGTFQRVQDHIIEIVNAMDAARWTTNEALWKIDNNKPDWRIGASLAKAMASEAFTTATHHSHEVLAGLGSVKDHPIHHYTTMSRTLYWYLGEPKLHRQKLADLLEL
ncbi:MAG: acyl-CoA/acyl-ACP dehydrogenase [Chloroflexi bacterium]|nr:acyl-CoA/acyl-ACP dehydrogenase [Chloroflexota bacterium]